MVIRLIYQLLDYERALKKDGTSSPTPSDRSTYAAAEDEEWGRRRATMEESPSDTDDNENDQVAREARALDKAMEDRVVARKTSSGSISSLGSGIGMGPAWKSRYGGRNRASSVASSLTNGSSAISEDLVEEDEESELLGVGGGFDESTVNSPEDDVCSISSDKAPSKSVPPSAPASRSTFMLPRVQVPATATQSSFNLATPRASKSRHRPPPLAISTSVPFVPTVPILLTSKPSRVRAESRKPETPPFHLRKPPPISQPLPTPSQTLFVFPPCPNLSTQTPSTMILTPSVSTFLPFPSVSTPRVSSLKTGRRMSFIGVGAPATPTTAYSRVDARGWIGKDSR